MASKIFDSFRANIQFLCLLKTSENQGFSKRNQEFPNVFRGYRNGTLKGNGLMNLLPDFQHWKNKKH